MDRVGAMIIMRGAPGSGKSTMVSQFVWESMIHGLSTIVCSTDQFFVKDGVYKFDPTLLGKYHKENFIKAQEALIDGIDVIIIDNTNMTRKECEPYVDIALASNYVVQFEEPKTPWAFDAEELVKRNVHGVPIESIRRMLNRWEETGDIGEFLAEKYECEYDIVHQRLYKDGNIIIETMKDEPDIQ